MLFRGGSAADLRGPGAAPLAKAAAVTCLARSRLLQQLRRICSARGQSSLAQRRGELAFEEVEKVFLVRSYLHKNDVVEAHLRERANGL